jgi:dolichol kinase
MSSDDLADDRECSDDGVLFALLLAPLIASGMLHDTMQRLVASSLRPRVWRIEDPLVLPTTPVLSFGTGAVSEHSATIKALSALATSRRNLVQLFTLCSFVLLVHLARSLHMANRLKPVVAGLEREASEKPRGELGQYWLKRGEWRRTRSVVVFAFIVTAVCILFKIATAYIGRGVWSGESPVVRD